MRLRKRVNTFMRNKHTKKKKMPETEFIILTESQVKIFSV